MVARGAVSNAEAETTAAGFDCNWFVVSVCPFWCPVWLSEEFDEDEDEDEDDEEFDEFDELLDEVEEEDEDEVDIVEVSEHDEIIWVGSTPPVDEASDVMPAVVVSLPIEFASPPGDFIGADSPIWLVWNRICFGVVDDRTSDVLLLLAV